MKNDKTKTDRLASLVNEESELTKTGQLALSVETPEIRDALADCINARCDADSMNALIVAVATNVPAEKLAAVIKVFSLSNGSQLRQALEKGFSMPTSGKAAKAVGSLGI